MNHAVNELILDKYIRIVLSQKHIFGSVNNSKEGYNFRCNVCGDSKKSKYKRRGWILKQKTPWMYYCFNGSCNATMPAHVWLKKYFYQHYIDYVKETMQMEKVDITIKETSQPVEVNLPKEEQVFNIDDLKYFKPIMSNEHNKFFKIAKCLCETRKIPVEVWKKWFVAIDGKYVGRLIIPFYDDKGFIYYFQARALSSDYSNKYINMVENRDEAIYNIHFIDRKKPVMLVEGPIDSLFLENAIAVCGLKFGEKIQKSIDEIKPHYLLDYDKDGMSKSLELLMQGKSVFLWEKFKRENNLINREKWDVNDAYLFLQREEPFTFEELKSYFSTSIYDKIYLMPKKHSPLRRFF